MFIHSLCGNILICSQISVSHSGRVSRNAGYYGAKGERNKSQIERIKGIDIDEGIAKAFPIGGSHTNQFVLGLH